jgi:hypothetical protein
MIVLILLLLFIHSFQFVPPPLLPKLSVCLLHIFGAENYSPKCTRNIKICVAKCEHTNYIEFAFKSHISAEAVQNDAVRYSFPLVGDHGGGSSDYKLDLCM